MDSMVQILRQARESLSSLRLMQFRVPEAGMVLFFVLLIFGILNGFLGYRLLRFWMMLIGFAIGASMGFGVIYLLKGAQAGRITYFLASVVMGVGVALITFFYYRAGIFLMVSAIGAVLAIYLLRPNSSAMFYLCLLLGIGLGLLALRYERNIVIVTTSLFGGALSAYCACKLLNLEEIPYGILSGIGLFLMGLVIQILMNPYEKPEVKRPKLSLGLHTITGKTEADKRNDAFYETYLDGMDVFDEDVKSMLPYTPSLAERVTHRITGEGRQRREEARPRVDSRLQGRSSFGEREASQNVGSNRPLRRAPAPQEGERPFRRQDAPQRREPSSSRSAASQAGTKSISNVGQRSVANIRMSEAGKNGPIRQKPAGRQAPAQKKASPLSKDSRQGYGEGKEGARRVYDYKLESSPAEKKRSRDKKTKTIDVYQKRR